MEIFALIVLLIVGLVVINILRKKARRKRLFEKYGNEALVDRIMRRTVWLGMSADQLLDSLGRPAAIDRKVYKSKIAETYKYAQQGKNRFRCRVKLENDLVVGWEER